jgi:hypothetical protein
MNGIVPAQAVKLGKFTSGLRQRSVNANHVKLRVQVVDSADRTAQHVCVDPTDPAGQCGRGACLWIYELTGCYEIGSVPELFGEVGPLLSEDELDQRGRIEVGDQRCCSATRSDTGSSD